MGVIKEEHIARKYLSILRRCEQNNIPFNLTLADVRKLFNTKTCPYTGIKIKSYKVMNGDSQPDDMVTVDRVRPELGYVKGNVVACSAAANQRKGDLDAEFILSMAKVVEKHS